MTYDQDYLTPDYFGDPFPELLLFFEKLPTRGLVIDMGCGQGRNAIPLARIGFEVLGLDLSSVGIDQMLDRARKEGLPVQGQVTDIYAWTDLQDAEVILLDSMFHFQKQDREKELAWISSLCQLVRPGTLLVFSILDTGKKVHILKEAIQSLGAEVIHEQPMTFRFADPASGHRSTSAYRLVAIQTKC